MVVHFCNFQVFFADQCSQRSAIANDRPLFAALYCECKLLLWCWDRIHRVFPLCCPFFNDERKKLFENLHGIKLSILQFQKDFLTNILFFGSDKFQETINRKMLQSTITCVKSSIPFKRLSSCFERPLVDQWHVPFVSLNKEEKIQRYYLVCYAFYVYVEDICTFFIGLQLWFFKIQHLCDENQWKR